MKTRFIYILLLISITVCGQDNLRKNKTNIYFKLNSTEYDEMPYPLEPTFKLIAAYIKTNGTVQLVIYRDTVETEQLSKRRIIKFKHDISKYTNPEKISFFVPPYSWQTNAEVLKKAKVPDIYIGLTHKGKNIV